MLSWQHFFLWGAGYLRFAMMCAWIESEWDGEFAECANETAQAPITIH